MPKQKYFEDYTVGERHTTGGRTMTEADIRLYIGASDNSHPVHVDREYCKKHPAVNDCVVQGCLVLGTVDGFMAREIVPSDVPVLHYGYDKVRFVRPVYPGDTIHCEVVVVDRKVKNDDLGIVCFEISVYNQNGETVIFALDWQCIGRRPASAES